MPRLDVEAMATEVVLLVKSALGPVLERLAVKDAESQAFVAVLAGLTNENTALRERVAVVETKAAQPVPPVDLGDVREYMRGVDSRHEVALILARNDLEKSFAALSERVVTVETKTAMPPPESPETLLRSIEDLFRAAYTGPHVSDPVLVDLSKDMATLRERVVTVETKAAISLPVPPEPIQVDLSLVLERIAATEARLGVIGDLRDRVVTVEAKAALPVLPLPPEAGWDDLRDRLVNLETKAAGPSLSDMGLTELRTQFATVQAKVFEVSERVAVVETRPLLAGPQGEPGVGKDGIDGKDGTPGLSFEGVYQDGKSYELGHLVTWAGSSWHCNEPTATKPGDGSKSWTLMVKRGRDGKDGRDAVIVPVVSVGAR